MREINVMINENGVYLDTMYLTDLATFVDNKDNEIYQAVNDWYCDTVIGGIYEQGYSQYNYELDSFIIDSVDNNYCQLSFNEQLEYADIFCMADLEDFDNPMSIRDTAWAAFYNEYTCETQSNDCVTLTELLTEYSENLNLDFTITLLD